MITLGDGEDLPPYFEPDGKGPWVVRYHWFQHEQNQEFLDQYFVEGTNELGLNLRNMTKDLKHLWDPHNAALARGEISGDMVWRIKTLNRTANSIDHIEVWKSQEVLDKIFHTDYPEWPMKTRNLLGWNLRQRGFKIRGLSQPYPSISKIQALRMYGELVKRAAIKDQTRIETRLKYSA